MNSAGNTTVARLVCDEATAKRLADSLSEHLDLAESAVEAFDGIDGRWNVEIHFEQAPDEAAIRRLIGGAGGSADVMFETIAARDWVAASLAGLKPVAAGRFTVHGAHDRVHVTANRIGIEIEAALAFGTGHHGTTRGCLLALDGIVKRTAPRRVLDIGTGTGVLAIAAAKALRVPVLASDIDPEAVRIARENARLNGIAPFLEYLHAAGLGAPRFRTRAPFDLVFANILLPPLKRRAVRPARRAGTGGARRLPATRVDARAAHSARRVGDVGASRMIPKSLSRT